MHKSILFIALILGMLSSCFKERIELDYNTDENKKLVITGWITSLDEPQFIDISRTVNYLGGFKPDKVSGAEVTLQDAINTYPLIEAEAGTYYLPSPWTARVGDTYKLKVVYEEKEYNSTHQMRPCPAIDDLIYIPAEIEDSIPLYETLFGFQEIPGEGDAYYGVDYLKGTLAGDSIVNGGFADDSFADGQYIEYVFLSEEDRYYKLGDTAVVEFFSIGLETSEFLQDIETEIYRGSPFDPPPANVRTNINGGAIGYFIVSDAKRAEVVIE